MAKKKVTRIKTSSEKPTTKATPADAQILLHLFDQRREEIMRKARTYIAFEFQPHTADDFMKTAMAMGTQEQTYFRMVFSYWEQAAALSVHGAVHADLFDEFAGEMYFLYAKFKDFVPTFRRAMNSPTAFSNIEKVVNRTAAGRERIERTQKMIAERFAPRAAKTAG